jgi:hypothetical protein
VKSLCDLSASSSSSSSSVWILGEINSDVGLSNRSHSVTLAARFKTYLGITRSACRRRLAADQSSGYQRSWHLAVGHFYGACHHFFGECNKWDAVELKFGRHYQIYPKISRVKGFKYDYFTGFLAFRSPSSKDLFTKLKS